MKDEPERPYPEGVAFDEAWRQRQRADKAEALLREAVDGYDDFGCDERKLLLGKLWFERAKEVLG